MHIFCDFDGTITNQDTIVYLTEKFGAGPEFRADILRQLHEGSLSITEAIRQELASVKITWDDALAAMDREVAVDPTFTGFVLWCRIQGYTLTVLSSGMEPVVRHFVGDPAIPVIAHRVRVEGDGWHYTPIPEHDKTRVLALVNGDCPVIYIGDGASDVCAIPLVDRLFAKQGRYLERYCREHAVPHTPFRDFDDVRRALSASG